jgi:alginate O-acetyltransferase complex protein AlgI
VLLLSTTADYALSFYLNDKVPHRSRRLALTVGIAGNLGMLIVYKYADFLLGNLNALLSPFGPHLLPLLHIALPIGVSFVVFEKITYLVDTYRGVSWPAASLWDYALFVFFFPKLLAGPILKYHEMRDQIAAPPPIQWSDFGDGFLRFARGLGRKLLIADPLGAFANQVFSADPANLGASYAWLGLACFAVQIYFDFAGYSDMAIGLARMLGFRLRENFNAPYISQSLTEFWRRWHISLTTWIRDYLYRPLGGNRQGEARTYLNLWICFLASGLWHGASWNFVLWGAYNGLFLTLDRMFLRDTLQRCGRIVATAITLFIVMIGWALFRSEQPSRLLPFLGALFGMSGAGFAVSGNAALSLAGTRARATSLAQVGDRRRAGPDLCPGVGAGICRAFPALHLFQVLTNEPLCPHTPNTASAALRGAGAVAARHCMESGRGAEPGDQDRAEAWRRHSRSARHHVLVVAA